MLSRRSLLAALAAAPLLPRLARAQAVQLSELSAYLNGLRTVQGGFTQVNADGSLSTGTIYLKRPGRVRFEYAPPDQSLFLAQGGQVAVYDPRATERWTRFPLSQTPLSIILAENVDLGRAGMVTGHVSDGTSTIVTAQDPAYPEYGSIRLVFTASPVELRQWVVTDGSGAETTVILNDVSVGGQIPDRLFNIQAEVAARP